MTHAWRNAHETWCNRVLASDFSQNWPEVDCLECLIAGGIDLDLPPDRSPTTIDAWLDL